MRTPEETRPGGRADDAGFRDLFIESFPGVFRVAYRLTGNRAEAEDLAQEAFLRLFERPELWDRHHSRAWVCRVALNLGLNRLRDTGRRRRRLEELGSGREGAGAEEELGWRRRGESSPEEALAREEERRQVRSILSGLPDRQARLLLLRNSGLSYAEIAAVLEVAAGSVGTLLSRAEEAFSGRYRERFMAGIPESLPAANKENRHGKR